MERKISYNDLKKAVEGAYEEYKNLEKGAVDKRLAAYSDAKNYGVTIVLTDGRIGSAGTVTLPVQAVETGVDYNVEAGRISEITNPLDGVESCTNEAPITGGQDR